MILHGQLIEPLQLDFESGAQKRIKTAGNITREGLVDGGETAGVLIGEAARRAEVAVVHVAIVRSAGQFGAGGFGDCRIRLVHDNLLRLLRPDGAERAPGWDAP